MKLCLIAPVPPPYGGVSNWERIIEKEIRKDPDIEMSLINIAANKRPTDGRTIFDRIFYSGYVMLWAYCRLRRYIKENKVEIVHMTTSGGLGFYRDLLLVKLLKKKHIPIVYHIHFGRTVLYKEKQGREWKQICNLVDLADHVVTIDKSTYDIFRSFGEKISYINNPIDVDTYNSYDKTQQKKITYIGWMIKEKGIEELLQAFDEYSSKGSGSYKLELIGPGDIKYISYLKETYSCQNVEFVGELEHEKAMEKLASAEIFILPSYTEGFPNVILEAMSLKKPIISTGVGAIPEILDGGCGILIEKQSVESIVNALRDVLGNKDFQLQMGIRAYNKVLEKYDIKNTYLRYKKVWIDMTKA